MRTIETVLYQFDELTDDAKEKARDWYRAASSSDTYEMDEMAESLKALFKAAGITLKDWNLGACCYNFLTFDMGDAGELTGARALTWLENNLLAGLRMTQYEYDKKRKDYLSYGEAYRPGKVPPCPLTGVCWDEDFIEALIKEVKSGETLKQAFHSLADTFQHTLERAIDFNNEDENVEDNIRANEYEFTVDGKRA